VIYSLLQFNFSYSNNNKNNNTNNNNVTDLTTEKENENVLFAHNPRSIFSGKEHTRHIRGRKI
jgi:hypothetical protein